MRCSLIWISELLPARRGGVSWSGIGRFQRGQTVAKRLEPSGEERIKLADKVGIV